MAKCTIAIPVFNREKLVRHAIESALSQDVPGLEILIVDNCSTDATWSVLNSYSDPRLRLIRNSGNVGLFGNFNRCLNLARGKYLRFLCSDDRLPPDCLKRELAIMDENPNVVVLSTQGRRMDPEGRIIAPFAHHFQPGIYDGLQAIHAVLWFLAHYAYNPLNYPSGVLLRSESARHAGHFDTTMRMCGDVDFFLRVLEHGDLGVVDSLGCEITIHSHQESTRLLGDTATISELYSIVDRHRVLLEQVGTYLRIRTQLSAFALVLAFKYRRMGLSEDCRARSNIAWGIGATRTAMAVGVLRLLGLRLLEKTLGVRLIPVHPRTHWGTLDGV